MEDVEIMVRQLLEQQKQSLEQQKQQRTLKTMENQTRSLKKCFRNQMKLVLQFYLGMRQS